MLKQMLKQMQLTMYLLLNIILIGLFPAGFSQKMMITVKIPAAKSVRVCVIIWVFL